MQENQSNVQKTVTVPGSPCFFHFHCRFYSGQRIIKNRAYKFTSVWCEGRNGFKYKEQFLKRTLDPLVKTKWKN